MNPAGEVRNGVTDSTEFWGNDVDPLLDLDLPVSVRFGKVRMPLSQALDLGDGSIVELDSRVDDPVEVLVHGKVVALGQLVVVDGYYGVEVTSLAVNGVARAQLEDIVTGGRDVEPQEELEQA
ncbi:FliM/FliN family flagellar motor switch protein [uncultured Paludibaculum sp.]|uniref:FliM/FliN family flagellar motor switch protein n=1 Tax=uncultured Paludibaculum sp. TaxID=1765020 RepID=UPI002AAA8E9A|nr:FliM/FliN family flagellar motor switch protein [uncultured Paludibaculum sp.]